MDLTAPTCSHALDTGPDADLSPVPDSLVFQTEAEADDVALCEIGMDYPPLLPEGTAEAVCTDVRMVHFGGFGPRMVFDFQIAKPTEFARAPLRMFARWKPSWKTRAPISAKITKIIAVACRAPLKRRQRITKKLFVGAMYEVKVKTVHDGDMAYSTVEMILKRLTG